MKLQLLLLAAAAVPAVVAKPGDTILYVPQHQGVCVGHQNDFPEADYPDLYALPDSGMEDLGFWVCGTQYTHIKSCQDLCTNTEGCVSMTYTGQGGQNVGCCNLQSTPCTKTTNDGTRRNDRLYVNYKKVENAGLDYPASIIKSAKYWYATGLYFYLQESPCDGTPAVDPSRIKSFIVETKQGDGSYSFYTRISEAAYISGDFNMGSVKFPSEMNNFRFVVEYTADDGRELTYYDYFDTSLVEPETGEDRRTSGLQLGWIPCSDNWRVGGNLNYRPTYTVIDGLPPLLVTLDPLPDSLVATGCAPFIQSDDDEKIYECNKDGAKYRFYKNSC